MVFFTAYANKKFLVLEHHGVVVARDEVATTAAAPDTADNTRMPLIFARKKLDDGRTLCVVYKKEGELQKIITFYPARYI